MTGRENDLKFATMMIRGALVSSLPSNLECRAFKFLNLQLAPNFSQANCITVSQSANVFSAWAAAAQDWLGMIGLPVVSTCFNKQPVSEAESLTSDRADARSLRLR